MPLTGRGGYGNYVSKKAAEKELQSVPSTPAPVQHFSSPRQTFRAGRGGYGNNVPISRMAVLSPNEYLEEVHQALDVEPESYVIGRGGAGNFVAKTVKKPALGPAWSGSSLSSTESSSSRHRSAAPQSGLSPVASMPSPKFRNDLQPTFSSSLWTRLKSTISH